MAQEKEEKLETAPETAPETALEESTPPPNKRIPPRVEGIQRTVEAALLGVKTSGKRYTPEDYRQQKPLEWQHVAFVRALKRRLPIASGGFLVERTPYAVKTGFRNTVHLTANHMVESHALGDWSASRLIAIAHGQTMKEIHGAPKVMNEIDTFYDKPELIWPKGTIFIYFEGDEEAEKLQHQFGADYHFIKLKKGDDPKLAVADILHQLGYQPISGGMHYSEDYWFTGPYADLGRREGSILTDHQHSDEKRRDDFFKLEAWNFFAQDKKRAAILRDGTSQLEGLFSTPLLNEQERAHIFNQTLNTVIESRALKFADYNDLTDLEKAKLELRASFHAIVYGKLAQLAESEWTDELNKINSIFKKFHDEYWTLLLSDFNQTWMVDWNTYFGIGGRNIFPEASQRPIRVTAFQKLREQFPYVRRGLEKVLGKESMDAALLALPPELSDLKEIPSKESEALIIEL